MRTKGLLGQRNCPIFQAVIDVTLAPRVRIRTGSPPEMVRVGVTRICAFPSAIPSGRIATPPSRRPADRTSFSSLLGSVYRAPAGTSSLRRASRFFGLRFRHRRSLRRGPVSPPPSSVRPVRSSRRTSPGPSDSIRDGSSANDRSPRARSGRTEGRGAVPTVLQPVPDLGGKLRKGNASAAGHAFGHRRDPRPPGVIGFARGANLPPCLPTHGLRWGMVRLPAEAAPARRPSMMHWAEISSQGRRRRGRTILRGSSRRWDHRCRASNCRRPNLCRWSCRS